MAHFSNLAARLAFQVDKKILQLEEESYMRMDFSAHEAILLQTPPFSFRQIFGNFKRFALTALAIYLVLFSINNAPAYVKILTANIEPVNLASSEESSDVITEKIAEEKALAILPAGENETNLLGLSISPTSYENRIEVPSLGINAPIVEPLLGLDSLQAKDWNALEDQIRSSLLSGVAHYPGTAEPGKIGNAFLTGHSSNVLWEPSSYNTVFALLPKIEIGADIFITHEQKTFHYRVLSTKEVSPSDTSILKQGDLKMLTLMTCTPVGTTLKRFVVNAELIKD